MSYSLALGPFHPAWRGPQRFVLSLDGERIRDVEYTGDYNARGCAARLARISLDEGLRLVARICGSCAIAHTYAFCLAVEKLTRAEVGPRATALRCAAAELERAASHLESAGRVVWSLGMERQADELGALAGDARGALGALAGSPVAADLLVPGGVARDLGRAALDDLRVRLPRLNRALYRRIDRMIDSRALLARTVDVGALPRAAAEQFGVRGPMARASGIARDSRVDQRYGLYGEVELKPITQEGGDVYARLMVLLLEAYESVKLVEQVVRELPEGAWRGESPAELPRGQATAGVEGPGGALRYALESDGARVVRAQIDAPRHLDRLLARTVLSGALIDNAAAIIASADHCTACSEC